MVLIFSTENMLGGRRLTREWFHKTGLTNAQLHLLLDARVFQINFLVVICIGMKTPFVNATPHV